MVDGFDLTPFKGVLRNAIEEAIKLERFVKLQAHLYGVAHLKDVLEDVRRKHGLERDDQKHVQTDEIEQEREEVVAELRKFLTTNTVKDGFDLELEAALEMVNEKMDEDHFRFCDTIRDRTKNIKNKELQFEVNRERKKMDKRVRDYQKNEAFDLARHFLIIELAALMDVEDVVSVFPEEGQHEKGVSDKRAYLETNAGIYSDRNLLITANSLLQRSGHPVLDYDQEVHRNEVYDLLAGRFPMDTLQKSFPKLEDPEVSHQAYLIGKSRRLADEGNMEELVKTHALEEYEEFFSEFGSDPDQEDEPADAIDREEPESQQSFRYVPDHVTVESLPRTSRTNLPAYLKVVFDDLPAFELRSLGAVDVARRHLCARYPHAELLIDGILNGMRRRFLFGQERIQTRPILIAGSPGCGKSSLARELMNTLGVHASTINAGGISDNHALGVSSGYSSALPSIVTTTVAEANAINPAIIVDEVDKSSQGSRNGDLTAGLLSLLEPLEAKSWFETFLNTNVDASHINWVLTANDIERVPLPLVSRCAVYRMESPGPEHVRSLAQSVIDDYAAEMGVDPRFFSLSVHNLEELQSAMSQHRSVRILRELVRMMLDERASSDYQA